MGRVGVPRGKGRAHLRVREAANQPISSPERMDRRFAPGTPAQLAHLDPDGMSTAPGRPAGVAELGALLDEVT